MKAVILAGGLGTRLRPLTFFLPKPMLPLGDKPVLEHLILWLKRHGITDIILSVEYLRRVIEDYFKDGNELGVKITYVRSDRPMGTAGQLKVAEKEVNGTFICLYGDSLYNFNLSEMIKFHNEKKGIATMALYAYKIQLRYGFIDLDESKKIVAWREKPEISGLINIGLYIMEQKFLSYIPSNTVYGMDAAFKNALDSGESIYGYPIKDQFIDIGDKKSYYRAHEMFTRGLGYIP
jgi:mannose-1-phosphate guanylyltransferase